MELSRAYDTMDRVWMENQTHTTESFPGLYSSIFQKYEPKNKYVSLSWSQWIAEKGFQIGVHEETLSAN